MIIKWHSDYVTLIKDEKLQRHLRLAIAGMLYNLAHEIENTDEEIKVPISGTIKTEIDILDARFTIELEWPTDVKIE